MSALEAVADRISRGDALSDADAETILATTDIIAVGMLADEARRQRHGVRTTFVRVFEIHVATVPAALPPRLRAGEVRIVGRPADEDSAVAAVRNAAALAGATPLTGFSLDHLLQIAGSATAVGALCVRLRAEGLQGVAEVRVDAIEDAAAPVEAARHAGLAVQRLTVGSAAGGAVISTVARARALQDAVGGFCAFAPLPRDAPADMPTTGYEDVKCVALARLMTSNIPSIQVDWPLYGPKLAQVALTMGADDVDGIEAVDPGILGTRRSPIEEITGNIRAASLDPRERDGLFKPL
jgi:aminodeoxyfutalosine synthase